MLIFKIKYNPKCKHKLNQQVKYLTSIYSNIEFELEESNRHEGLAEIYLHNEFVGSFWNLSRKIRELEQKGLLILK